MLSAPPRVGINGFGRMGRLALRAGWGRADLELVHVNELRGDAATGAHLLVLGAGALSLLLPGGARQPRVLLGDVTQA